MSVSQDQYTVIIADDHTLVRSGLREVFGQLDNVTIVGEAGDGLEAMTLARTLKPSLMTLDAAMPHASGIEVYGELRRWVPDTRIAVVTGFGAGGHLADWVAAGVDGLFLKTCPYQEMLRGFEIILSGTGYVSEAVSTVLDAYNSDTGVDQLTARERQILHLLAEGFSSNELADKLSISPKTVNNHRTHMMAKLKVRSLGQLIALALKEGLLDKTKQH